MAKAPLPSITRSRDLESRIGSHWLNRIGILSLVLGTAFFLVYSFQYLGPLAKVAMGYGVGVLGVCAQYRLHRWGLRRYPIFEPGGRKLVLGPAPEPVAPGPSGG